MLDVLALPFLACLVLTGIHAYLGLHVLARGVIFVDLALAQVAALGVTVAFLAGHSIQSAAAYWYALAFTVGGAALFAATRLRRAPVPQEAIIGIVYAVAAAAVVLVVDRAPQGTEHIKQLLVGSILTITGDELVTLTVLYAAIGVLHWAVRRPLLAISFAAAGTVSLRRVRLWDFLFYASFGLVVTSSVRAAGVLLVFSYLIVPATVAALLARSVARRLAIGWVFGSVASAAGLILSYVWDLPTGAAVVATFGGLLGMVALALGGRALAGDVRARGVLALRGVGIALAAVVAAAGVLLAVFPRMDHPWLTAIEELAPIVQTTFLTPGERGTWEQSREAIRRDQAEMVRLRALQQDVQWGRRQIPPETQERLRQFLAGRGEIAAGERLVLRTLQGRARDRQRYWLGVPLAALGALAVAVLAASGRRRHPVPDGSHVLES